MDGVLHEGGGAVDEAMITGEAMPVTKRPGDRLIAGTINRTGGFTMTAEKIGRDTMLAQIVGLVAAAHVRAPDPAARRQGVGLVRAAVIAVAVLAFAVWSIFGPSRGSPSLVASVAVLIYRLPLRARPRNADVDHGRRRPRRGARRAGPRRRDARTHGARRYAGVDKTGTLTEGKPAWSRSSPWKVSKNEMLR